jgi:hypothetical protein
MKSNEGAKLHMAAKRRGLRASIDGETITFYAGQKRVWRGPADDARGYLATLKTTSKSQREIARLRLRQKEYRKVRHGDVGLASEDHTPAGGAQGLVETELMLPREVSADFALVSLWVLENTRPHAPARTIIAELAAAERMIASEGRRARVFLSDHDRASLARYRVAPSIALTAAALARAQSRTR